MNVHDPDDEPVLFVDWPKGPALLLVICDKCGNRTIAHVERHDDFDLFVWTVRKPPHRMLLGLRARARHRPSEPYFEQYASDELIDIGRLSGSLRVAVELSAGDKSVDLWCPKHGHVDIELSDVRAQLQEGRVGRPARIRVFRRSGD
jgi:hypothetical protein